MGEARFPSLPVLVTSLAMLLLSPSRASAYVACASGATVEGVDVSSWQGTIDWAQVKGSGRDFALIRASFGASSVDSAFGENWSAAKAAGLTRGAVHQFLPASDAVQQADLFVGTVGTLEPGDLPLAVDVSTDDGMYAAAVLQALSTFVNRVESATGLPVIVYTSRSFWDSTLGSPAGFGALPLWIANWGAVCPDLPASWASWTFWQYSTSGSVPGMSGSADLDLFNGSLQTLSALTVQPANEPPATTSESQGGCGCGGVVATAPAALFLAALALRTSRRRERS